MCVQVALGDLIGVKACQAYDVELDVSPQEGDRFSRLFVKFVLASTLAVDVRIAIVCIRARALIVSHIVFVGRNLCRRKVRCW